MLLQTITKDNEKIVWFDSSEPRYYKAFNNKLYYSDNLFQWKPASTKRESIAIHLIKDELGLGELL